MAEAWSVESCVCFVGGIEASEVGKVVHNIGGDCHGDAVEGIVGLRPRESHSLLNVAGDCRHRHRRPSEAAPQRAEVAAQEALREEIVESEAIRFVAIVEDGEHLIHLVIVGGETILVAEFPQSSPNGMVVDCVIVAEEAACT